MTKISTEYITLSQLLKLEDFASTGGQAKLLVKELKIKVNDQPENRRGKKLYPGDRIEINGKRFVIEK